MLDKPSFQMLSYNEMILLNNYYQHNITPLLVMEILGDLKKELSEEGEIKTEKVIELSTKLFPYNAVVNEYYRNLVKHDLLGNNVDISERPILGNGKLKISSSGKKGTHFEPSIAEQALLRWRMGEFLESDKILSAHWRNTTTNKEYVENLKRQLKSRRIEGKKIKNLDELNNEVEETLNSPELQFNLLVVCCQNYGLTPAEANHVLTLWHKAGRHPIKEYAPYAAHCLKVDLFYNIGLQFDLMSERPTDKVDLQYFYYLPFTNLFSSNDRIHRRMIPYFIKNNQTFIIGQDLKADLKSLVEYRETLTDSEKESTLKDPPVIETSLTYQLYKKYFNYPASLSLQDDKPKEWYIKKMKEFEAAVDLGSGNFDGEGEFVAKKSWMSVNDPCPCGSGKALKDCHLPKDYFDKNRANP